MRNPLPKLALAALLALALAPAAAAEVPDDATYSQATFPSGDGTTLHADILRPKNVPADAKTPVILSIGPYYAHSGQTGAAGTGDDFDPTRNGPNDRFKDIWDQGKVFQKGYTWVQADLRGFGGSSGCNDFGGVGEQADVKAAVEWAASQKWSTGKVGMWGKSYDGWTQVMALATAPKGLSALVIQSPIIDGYRTLYMNGVHYDSGWYATPGLYQSIDTAPPTVFDAGDPAYMTGVATGTNPPCYAQNIGNQTANIDRDNEFWDSRNLIPRASKSTVPVMWSHGLMDANTKPDNFLDVWAALRGPKRAWFGQYNHVRGTDVNTKTGKPVVGRTGFAGEAMRWFDRYLKGDQSARVEDDPPVAIEESDGRWRQEAQWPPADAQRLPMPIKPGSYTDAPNNDAEGNTTGSTGVGTWTFSQPLPYEAFLSGVVRFTGKVEVSASRVTLVALLYDVDPAAKKGTLITRGAAAVTQSGTVDFSLYPQDWRLKPGHRLGLLVAGADEDWFTPPHSGSDASVTGGAITVPYLRYQRNAFIQGGPADYISTRRPIAVDPATFKDASVAATLPPALAPAPPGGVPASDNVSEGYAPGQGLAASYVPRATRLTVSLRALRRGTLRVSGRAPSGGRVGVQLRRHGRTVVFRRATARNGVFGVTFRVRGAAGYSVVARLRSGNRTLKARSPTVRIRR